MEMKLVTGIILLLVITACHEPDKRQKIDRYDLVTRHNVEINEFDSLNSLSIGNGSFAFTADPTGLQTFPELYKNGVCLGTQSEWGWHSFPNTENYRLEESFQYYAVEGRQIPYAVQPKEAGRKQDASNYFRVNPHRLHLGYIGLEVQKEDKSVLKPENISHIDQQLNLWQGLITSRFSVEEIPFEIQTVCDPDRDLIGIEMNSEWVKNGKAGLNLRFPYPTGLHVDDATDWGHPDKHQSEIIDLQLNSAIIRHIIDTTAYFVQLTWNSNARLTETSPHHFSLLPEPGNSSFSASVEFSLTKNFAQTFDFKSAAAHSAEAWRNFWETGGAVDFSGSTDPQASELERRVILSQYLLRIQCAGSLPPQETGLTFNSWYGKPHLEMHWWHEAQWAFWNRPELLEKSMQYYFDIFQKAKEKAVRQGYKGVRWPKMTDPWGNDSPSSVGEFLIWQQPHFIYFAELMYRANPSEVTLEKYAPLVFETANFMADFARWDAENGRYILGPPLIPAQESLDRETTVNPPFELAYWHWALSAAQLWKERLKQERDTEWQNVLDQLSVPAQKDGLYLAAESAPDSYDNEKYYSDHPIVLGAFGMMPGLPQLDTTVMAATFDHINKIWNWESTWGWDYPMAAMSATRLAKPEQATDILMKEVLKNTYLKNGHNYQGTRLRIYLPGNGALLSAVAMMCAGYTGCETKNPGFPEGWTVKWENLQPVF
jgi:hypothetical protein